MNNQRNMNDSHHTHKTHRNGEMLMEMNKLNFGLKKQQKNSQSVIKTIQKHKSSKKLVFMCIILAFSAFQFGYALSEVSTIPFSTIIKVYFITIDAATAEGLVNGILPIGGILGSMLNKFFQKYFTRKMAHHPLTVITILSSVLSIIPNFYCLVLGRFLLGISCGLYTALAPVYLKELAPRSLRPTLSTFFSNGRVVGIVFCYSLGLFCQYVCPDISWYIMFTVPGLIAIIQSLGVFLYLPNSPPQMAMKDQQEELLESVAAIYKEQYVYEIVTEYKQQVEKQKLKQQQQRQKQSGLQTQKIEQVGSYIDYGPNRRRAFLMALHISFLRQMIGTNFLVVYSSQAMTPIDPKIAQFTPLIINFIQLCCGITATLYITNKFGRRTMLLFGVATLTIQNFGIGVGFYFSSTPIILIFMVLMMMSFGSTFSPVSWPYPTEIIPPHQVPYTTFLNWVGVTIITALPPIILAHTSTAADIFFFFGAWSFFSTIYIYFSAIQIKGLTYEQIVARF